MKIQRVFLQNRSFDVAHFLGIYWPSHDEGSLRLLPVVSPLIMNSTLDGFQVRSATEETVLFLITLAI